MNRRFYLSLFLLMFLTSFLTTANLVIAQPDLRLGFIGPLTGNAAVLGADALPAIELAIEEEKLNGIEINLFVEDDQYVTAKSMTAYKKLVDIDKVDSMIFLTYGGMLALKDLMAKDQVIVIDTLDCDQEIAKIEASNVFCITTGTEDLGEVVAKATIAHHVSPVSFLYFDGDPFMGILAKATKNYLEKNSSTPIVSYQGYSGNSDFRTILLKAKSLGSKGYIFYGYDDLGNALYQARSLGIKDNFYGVNSMTSSGFKKAARNALEGTYVGAYIAPRTKKYEAFIEAFKKKTGKTPSFEVSTFSSYDTTKILAQGVREYKASAKIDPIKKFLVNYLLSVKGYEGLAGLITIDPDGATRTLKNSLFRVNKDGELVGLK